MIPDSIDRFPGPADEARWPGAIEPGAVPCTDVGPNDLSDAELTEMAWENACEDVAYEDMEEVTR